MEHQQIFYNFKQGVSNKILLDDLLKVNSSIEEFKKHVNEVEHNDQKDKEDISTGIQEVSDIISKLSEDTYSHLDQIRSCVKENDLYITKKIEQLNMEVDCIKSEHITRKSEVNIISKLVFVKEQVRDRTGVSQHF